MSEVSLNRDWNKELENLRERIQHCSVLAMKLKATLEPVARELSMYEDLMRNVGIRRGKREYEVNERGKNKRS